MALDRWIALIILAICVSYGYAAWFAMDASLAPFMRRNPIWPSTFPKVLSILGAIAALFILFGVEKPSGKKGDIDYTRLREYFLGQAIALLILMVLYALSLRPMGFLLSTTAFLILGPMILGERRWVGMVATAVIATGIVWYIVQAVLGIYLRPFPGFMGV